MVVPITIAEGTSAPFKGGVITRLDRAQLRDGQFSTLQNIRNRYDGFEQRAGQIEKNTTADASTEIVTIFQFAKDNIGTTSGRYRQTYAQYLDGSLQAATSEAPTVDTTFGSDALPAIANTLPASYSNYDGRMFYSDGARQHKIFVGNMFRISGFNYYSDSASAPPIFPTQGTDYIDKVSDGIATTEASDLLLHDKKVWYIMTESPALSLTFDLGTSLNAQAATLAVKFFELGYALSAVTGLSDGTASGGATMAQDGTVSWTATSSDERPILLFGKVGFWYQLTASAQTDVIDVIDVTYANDPVDIMNVWDGDRLPPLEVLVYTNSTQTYTPYPSSAVVVNKLATDDWLYIPLLYPAFSFYVTVTLPNKNDATVTGVTDILFTDRDSGNDWITTESKDIDFIQLGFEVDMDITVSGTTSNNFSGGSEITILAVTSKKIEVPAGTLADEADQSAVLTFSNDVDLTWVDGADKAFERLDADGTWGKMSGVILDGTNGLTRSGYVLFDDNSIGARTHFNDSQHDAYWYRLHLDAKLSNDVQIGIEALPMVPGLYDEKLGDGTNTMDSVFGLAMTNVAWKQRMCYTFDRWSQFVYVSALGKPMTLNGEDFAVLRAGDGRNNRVLAMVNFYNELLVIQEEIGKPGGCTTLFEGNKPGEYGRIILSSKIGILNPKAIVVVDGVVTSAFTNKGVSEEIRQGTIAFWISKYGLMACDGEAIYAISDDIQNYFDPTHDDYINLSYKDKMFVEYDELENVVLFGLVSGASQTTPNVFPVYDPVVGEMIFDKRGQELSCMRAVESDASSGDDQFKMLMLGGGSTTGKVYQLNTTNDDVSTPIDMDIKEELDDGGHEFQLDYGAIRTKALSSGDLTQEIAIDGNTSFGHTEALSMIAANSGDTYRRHRFSLTSLRSDHFTIRWRNNEAGVRPRLYDRGYIAKRTEANV